MGKKKPFLNKKEATTYSLVYRTAEEEAEAPDGPDRVLVPVEQLGRLDVDQEVSGPSRSRYPSGHPLGLLLQAEDDISAERRREIVDLGLPDDGYDYLKHLRVVGQGTASLSSPNATQEGDDAVPVVSTSDCSIVEPVGPAVFISAPTFVPPQADVKLLDSRGLAVEQPAADDEDAAQRLAGVTAFSRQPRKLAGAVAMEVEELQQCMRKLENIDEVPEEQEQDGCGDWLDEFVLTATKPKEVDAEGRTAGAGAGVTLTKQQQARLSAVARTAAEAEGERGEDDEDGDQHDGKGLYLGGDEDETGLPDSDEDNEGDDHEEEEAVLHARLASRAVPRRGPGSISSSVWSRPERHDRNTQLELIDERFEQLALQYDEDMIGELDEDVRGAADVNDFSEVLNAFLEASNVHEHRLMEKGGLMVGMQAESKVESLDEYDPDVAARTKEAIARQLECEASNSGKPSEGLGVVRVSQQDPTEHWDCESILSLRSNTEHHPARISEPGRVRATPVGGVSASGIISLSQKTGLPSGYSLGGAQSHRQPPGQAHERPEAEQDTAGPSLRVVARRKDETAEEKRLRKADVKEAKRVARENKKGLKLIFKEASGQHKKLLASMGPSRTVTIPIS